jgi:porin
MEPKLPDSDHHVMRSLGLAAAILGFLLSGAAATRADSSASIQPSSQPSMEEQSGPDFSDKLTGDWFAARRKLADAGVTIGADLVLEGFDNFQGGLDTAHPVGATTFDLNCTFDMEKLAKIDGGQFYVDLEDHAFANPTTALVGDLQVFDKLNASPYLQIFEAWYQQTLLNGALRLKVGKVDANSEFCVIDNGLLFLNSSTQVSPTIFTMPTTPDPMPSINAFFTPTDWYFAGVGAYYANRSDRFGDLVDDPASVQPTKFGTLIIGETGLQWHGLLNFPGNVKLGAWGHTGTFQKFDGTQQRGADGMYVVFDQTLYQPAGEKDSDRGLRMFAEYGLTQPDVNPIDRHIGGGFTDTGPDIAFPHDTLGISAQYAHISYQAGLKYPYELAIEGFVRHPLTPWASVQPDLQYIIHPGGKLPDAVVLTLRLELDF